MIFTKCGQQNNSNFQKSKRSNFWYLLPIVFGIAGGLIAYLVLRKSDSKKARNCLIIGVGLTLIGLFILSAVDFFPNDSNNVDLGNEDWVEEYWAQHPDEDPCNDPTARAFGLCG